MSEIETHCDYIDKKTTQYIRRVITQRFIDVWNELAESNVPQQHILRGATLAVALSTECFTLTKDFESGIGQVYDDVAKVIENNEKKGIHFAKQAAALELLIPQILGISYNDLE